MAVDRDELSQTSGRDAQAAGLHSTYSGDAVGMHVNQIKKYEAGNAQPALGALIKLAQILHVSIDEMVFEQGERGP